MPDLSMPDDISVQQYTLEWLKIGMRAEIPQSVLDTVELSVWRNDLIDNMVFALRAKVLADELPPEQITQRYDVTWTVPASPWQHFKQNHDRSWWLRWLVARHPVRLDDHRKTVEFTVDLHRYHTYPEARVTPSWLGHPVKAAVVNTHWWEEQS